LMKRGMRVPVDEDALMVRFDVEGYDDKGL
jgi:hypothetical protein